MSMRTIGENLRDLRDRKSEDQGRKITQTDVAAVMGVEKNTVWKWEHDKVQLSADQIVRLADFYQVSTDELLRGGKAESLVMMNETGLSDQTIDRLRKNKARGNTKYAETINLLCDPKIVWLYSCIEDHAAINRIMSRLPSNGEMILSHIYNFIHCDNLQIAEDPAIGGEYIGSQPDLYLLRITNELRDLREIYQETRKKSKDQKKESDEQGKEILILEREHLF